MESNKRIYFIPVFSECDWVVSYLPKRFICSFPNVPSSLYGKDMVINPMTTINPINAAGPPGEVFEDPVFPVTSSEPLAEVVVALLLSVAGLSVAVWSELVPPLLPVLLEVLPVETPLDELVSVEVVPESVPEEVDPVEPVSVVPVSVLSPVPGSVGTSIGVPCPGCAVTAPQKQKAIAITNIRRIPSSFICLITSSPLS